MAESKEKGELKKLLKNKRAADVAAVVDASTEKKEGGVKKKTKTVVNYLLPKAHSKNVTQGKGAVGRSAVASLHPVRSINAKIRLDQLMAVASTLPNCTIQDEAFPQKYQIGMHELTVVRLFKLHNVSTGRDCYVDPSTVRDLSQAALDSYKTAYAPTVEKTAADEVLANGSSQE